jgi:hypothetical protein
MGGRSTEGRRGQRPVKRVGWVDGRRFVNSPCTGSSRHWRHSWRRSSGMAGTVLRARFAATWLAQILRESRRRAHKVNADFDDQRHLPKTQRRCLRRAFRIAMRLSRPSSCRAELRKRIEPPLSCGHRFSTSKRPPVRPSALDDPGLIDLRSRLGFALSLAFLQSEVRGGRGRGRGDAPNMGLYATLLKGQESDG